MYLRALYKVSVPCSQTSICEEKMPTLTFRCCRETCGREYDSTSAKPRCPYCRSTRAQWIPVKIAVRKAATKIDATVKEMQKAYRFTDLRKPYAGERMLPPRAQNRASGMRTTRIPGFDFDVPVATTSDGQIALDVATCTPNGISSRVAPKWGHQRPSGGVPGTVIEKSTTQRTLPSDDNPG